MPPNSAEHSRPQEFPVVLSGAGLSADHPANAPLGDMLRDALLERLLELAGRIAPDMCLRLRSESNAIEYLSRWRLEVLLSILHEVIGDRAFAPLHSVRTGEPNEAHARAARLLNLVGAPRLHLTLNFDDYVEQAFRAQTDRELMTFEASQASSLEKILHADWIRLTTPAVIHLHGRVLSSGYPGLVATLERIAAPPSPVVQGILRRAVQHGLLVTGYSGWDTDLWPILRQTAIRIPRAAVREWNGRVDLTAAAEAGGNRSWAARTLAALNAMGFTNTDDGAANAIGRYLGEAPLSSPPRKAPSSVEIGRQLDLTPAEALLILAWVCEDASARRASLWALRRVPSLDVPSNDWLRWHKIGVVTHELGKPEFGAFDQALRRAPDRRRAADTLVLRADACRFAIRDRLRHCDLIGAALAWRQYRASLRMGEHLATESIRTEAQNRVLAEETLCRAARTRGHLLLRLIDVLPSGHLLAPLRLWLGHRATRYLFMASHSTNPHTSMYASLQLADALTHRMLSGDSPKLLRKAQAAIEKAQGLSEFVQHPLVQANLSVAQGFLLGACRRLGLRQPAHWGDDPEAILADAIELFESQAHESGLVLVRRRRAHLEP